MPSVVLVASVGCATVEVPELRPHTTLPASKDGFWVNTLKDEEGEIPAPLWKKKLEEEAHVILFSKDWASLRFTILKNCLTMQCQQSVGTLDNLFYTLDEALKKMNAKKKSGLKSGK